jgi:hypothetical protein
VSKHPNPDTTAIKSAQLRNKQIPGVEVRQGYTCAWLDFSRSACFFTFWTQRHLSGTVYGILTYCPSELAISKKRFSGHFC